MFFSIFLIVMNISSNAPVQYIPIASFPDRLSCEEAIITQTSLITTFDETSVLIRCMKTDEIVENKLLLLE